MAGVPDYHSAALLYLLSFRLPGHISAVFRQRRPCGNLSDASYWIYLSHLPVIPAVTGSAIVSFTRLGSISPRSA